MSTTVSSGAPYALLMTSCKPYALRLGPLILQLYFNQPLKVSLGLAPRPLFLESSFRIDIVCTLGARKIVVVGYETPELKPQLILSKEFLSLISWANSMVSSKPHDLNTRTAALISSLSPFMKFPSNTIFDSLPKRLKRSSNISLIS